MSDELLDAILLVAIAHAPVLLLLLLTCGG
jgi:hypothetical protein